MTCSGCYSIFHPSKDSGLVKLWWIQVLQLEEQSLGDCCMSSHVSYLHGLQDVGASSTDLLEEWVCGAGLLAVIILH